MSDQKNPFMGTGNPNILTNEQVIADEQKTIADLKSIGLDARYLMGNAAQSVCDLVQSEYSASNEFWIFCGKGNNGGDGLALAALLAQQTSKKVTAIICMWPSGPSYQEPALTYYTWLQKLKDIHQELTIVDFASFAGKKTAHKKLLIIDAVLGTGFSPPLKGEAEQVVTAMNEWATTLKAPLLSLDIPSGISGNGALASLFTEATAAISFHSMKPGLFLPELAGTLKSTRANDIGIERCAYQTKLESQPQSGQAAIQYLFTNPKKLLPQSAWYVYQPQDLPGLAKKSRALLQRQTDGHKYRHGAALVVAGGGATEGAFELLQSAFFAAGGGIMTTGTFDEKTRERRLRESPYIITADAETFLESLPEYANKYQNLTVGPGVIATTESDYFLKELWRRLADLPDTNKLQSIVVDAASLTTLAQVPEFIARQQSDQSYRLLLTPHSGELASLWQATTESDTFQKLSSTNEPDNLPLFSRCQILAAFYGAGVLLKGPNTMLFTPDAKTKIWPFNSEHLGVAGSGDILAGVLGRLMAIESDITQVFATSQWLQFQYGSAHSNPSDWLNDLKQIAAGEV